MANLVTGLGGPSGFGAQNLAANDDSSTQAIDVTSIFPDGFQLFGHTYTSIYVNNNGNITFGSPLSEYTPQAIGVGFTSPIIAPFWADVDTQGGATTPTGGNTTGSNLAWYNVNAATHTVTVTWDDVGYFSGHTDKTDAFQLQLIGTPSGGEEIRFIYQNVNWTAGDASGGSAGLGGTTARAGYSAGDGVHYSELPGSGTETSMLALPTTAGNTGTAGVWEFAAGGGGIYSLANPVISVDGTTPATAITFGNVRQGSTQSRSITVANAATTPAEALDVTATATGAATATGRINLLAPGQSDAADLVAGLNTSAVGAVTGSVTLGLTSDGSGTDGLPSTSLTSQTLAVTGTVYSEAQPNVVLPSQVTLHVGDSGVIPLAISDGAGDVENLLVTVVGTTGGMSAPLGALNEIAAGAAASLPLTVSTATPGVVTGTVTLSYASDGAGTDGAPLAAIGTQTVNVSVNVLGGSGPQLTVGSVGVPATATAGQTIPVSWTISNNGDAAASGPFSDQVFLASDAAGDNPQLVGALGFDGTLAAGQSIARTLNVTLPATFSGNQYVVIRTDALNQVAGDPAGPGRQAVTTAPIGLAASNLLSLSDITPGSGSNLGSVTLTVDGANFNANETVSVVASDGTARDATQVRWVGGGKIWATFDLRGLATGAYDVRIGDAGRSATLPSAFRVDSDPAGQLSVNLTVPPDTTLGQNGVATVTYANTGSTDIAAPILSLSSTQALLQGAGDTSGSADLTFLAGNANGPAGVLPPGATGSLSFIYMPIRPTVGENVSITLSEADPQNPGAIDWSSYEVALRPPTVDATDWHNVWTEFVARVGTTTASLTTALSQDASELSQVGQTTNDIGTLLRYELFQASGALAGTFLNGATDLTPTASSLSLSLDRFYNGTLLGRDATGAFGDGWTSTYDVTATADASGNVYVQSPGVLHVFTLGAGGSYTTAAGDGATLSVVGGLYQMRSAGGVEQFRADGRLGSVTDANGNMITLAYGSNGVLQTVTSVATGETITFTSNEAGWIVGAADSDGRQVSYSYDASGTLLLSASGTAGVTSYTYAPATGSVGDNALTSITNPDGTHVTFTYDTAGRLATQSGDNGAGLETYSYPSAGEVTVTDALGNSTSLLYGADGSVAQTQDALGHTTGRQTSATDALTSATVENSVYHYAYDASGNLTSYTDPLGGTVLASYAAGSQNLTGFTDQRGAQTHYTYDAAGNVTGITYQDGNGNTYQYGTDGLLSSSTDADGNTIRYSYDSAGNLTGKAYGDGTSNSYAYDSHGNLIAATAQDGGTTRYTYDSADRLTSVTDPAGRVESYTYNVFGRLASRTEPGDVVTQYSYDAYGRLAGLQDGTGNMLDRYTYNIAGQLVRTDTGNGANTTYKYDVDGNVTEILNSNADGSVASRFDYTYDANGQVVQDATSDGTWTYGYDSSGQLTHAVFASTNPAIQNQDISYVYDASGNRVSETANGVVTNYTTNALNQYTTVGGTTYTYDADGNMVSRTDSTGTTTFTYDQNGRLRSEAGPTGTFQYAYDAFGNLVSTTQNGVTDEYVNDPLTLAVSGQRLASIAQIYSAAAPSITTYSYGLGLAAAENSSGATYFQSDLAGNIVGLNQSSGRNTQSYFYLPFGQVQYSTGSVQNPFKFAGIYGILTGANGLESMRARIYDPVAGRFLSEDPIGILGGTNLYTYAQQRPVNGVDPTGDILFIVTGLVGAAAGGLGDITAQLLSNGFNFRNIDLSEAATAAAFGGIAGLAVPLLATTELGAAGVGAVTNLAQYFYVQYSHNDNFTLGGALFALGSGAVGGLIAGKLNNPFMFINKISPLSQSYVVLAANFNQSVILHGIGGGIISNSSTLINKIFELGKAIATALGCPHFTTYDGLHFDFQGAGEFIAARSTQPGDTFQVQMRIEPEGSLDSAVSIITQIAVQVGRDKITFGVPQRNDAPRPDVVWVDGAPATISMSNPVLTFDGGTVTEISRNQYRIVLNTGEVVTVDPFGDGMGVSIALGANDGPGSIQGFLGADEGQANDFQLADGTVLQQPLTQAQLYQQFANAWRVTDANSLLDYDPGQATASYTDTMYPREILRLSDFSPDLVSKAAALAAAAGITDPVLAADAEFDYLTMSNPSFFSEDAAVAALNPIASTPAVITEPAAPPPSVGILPDNAYIVEANGSPTSVTYIVNLTSAAATDTVVNYTVIHPSRDTGGKSFLDIADFGGSLPSGSVTIAAGQTQATITINVPDGAIGSTSSKWLLVAVTAPGGNLVYDPSGQTEIRNDQPAPGMLAEPVIQLLPNSILFASANPPILTHSENKYVLDLGQISSNTAFSPLEFAVTNGAAIGSDLLSGSIEVTGDGGFTTSFSPNFTNVAPGGVSSIATLTLDPTHAGGGTETLTITPTDTNATGYAAALPTETLVVSYTAAATATDTLTVDLSEDAYLGDAQAVISVDGVQQGGPVTVTASHAARQTQAVTLQGNFGSGPHVVSVGYFNDAYDPGVGDRNLYVDASLFNATSQDIRQGLYQNGINTFTVDGSAGSGMSFIATASTAATLSFSAATADLTGGIYLTAYELHAGDAGGTIENFFAAKGDTLTADVSLQGAFTEQDTAAGLLLGFGNSTGSVLLRGLTTTTFDTHNLYWAQPSAMV